MVPDPPGPTRSRPHLLRMDNDPCEPSAGAPAWHDVSLQRLQAQFDPNKPLPEEFLDRETSLEALEALETADLGVRKVVVSFADAEAVDHFFKLIGQKYTDRTVSVFFGFSYAADAE